MKILITGATGFIGRFLCSHLLAAGSIVYGCFVPSRPQPFLVKGVVPVAIEPIGGMTPWGDILAGIDIVIHLAARAHVMDDPSADPLEEYRKVNTAGTERLAREAVAAGVRRLVFVSSVKAAGGESCTPYREDSPARPSDWYGLSKFEAERILRNIEAGSDLDVVIVRPTLVYGPGVKANFLAMMKLIQGSVPLPLASIANRRSMIYVGNLVDALSISALHPSASGQTYMVSDGDDISTPQLVRQLASALGRPARLFPFPPSLLRLGATVSGKSSAMERLLGSLTVDASKIRKELGWVPPYTMSEGLEKTAEWFKETVPSALDIQ